MSAAVAIPMQTGVTIKMRPMRAPVLAAILGLALIPVCFMEPAFSFLPEEPVETSQSAALYTEVFSWPGDFFSELPEIKEEMLEHGYSVHICLDPENCAALFTRDDGTKITVSSGRWFHGPLGGQKDAHYRGYLTAKIEDPRSPKHFARQVLGRFGLHL